jgi:hypothetical protein
MVILPFVGSITFVIPALAAATQTFLCKGDFLSVLIV